MLDDAGRDVAPGQLGELYSRSPYLFNGYWNRPQATQECMLEGGWVSAGDIARRDPHGFLYIVDRKKDMVISGGINIYPREIELALEQHPAVLESAVVGVPDDHWGERLRAFVVVRPGVSADEQLANELARFCAATVAAYKVPRELGFIQEVPRNIGGKVLKRDLRVAALPVFVVHKREPQIHERA